MRGGRKDLLQLESRHFDLCPISCVRFLCRSGELIDRHRHRHARPAPRLALSQTKPAD